MLLLRDGRLLLEGESSSDSSGLLVSEVKGSVWMSGIYRMKDGVGLAFRLLVELSEVLSLLLVDDGEDSSNRFSDGRAGIVSTWF